VVECGQVPERVAGAGDALGGAVVAVRELREPLRAGREACGFPVAAVIGLAHELGGAVLEARLLCEVRDQLPPARRSVALERLINRPFRCTEHMFVHYHAATQKVCRNCANMRGFSPPQATEEEATRTAPTPPC
jgi:hypothetical protein